MKKILLAGLVLASASSFAWETKYGTAGCGLGSMIFGDQKGPVQILAATTNGTSANQTFGMTTGTSNCGKGALGNTAAFIEANKASLANDIARGNGETLNSLTVMYGCNDNGIGKVLQKNYTEIFPTADASAQAIDRKISGYMNSCQIKG